MVEAKEAFSPRRWWFIWGGEVSRYSCLLWRWRSHCRERSDGLTVAVIVDQKSLHSEGVSLIERSHAVEDAARGPTANPDDRLAVIQFSRDAVPTAMRIRLPLISLGNGPPT